MFRVLIQLSWFFKQQKKRYIIAISLLLLVSIFELTPAFLIGRAIDTFQRGAMSRARNSQRPIEKKRTLCTSV